jgi:hypothetical protein
MDSAPSNCTCFCCMKVRCKDNFANNLCCKDVMLFPGLKLETLCVSLLEMYISHDEKLLEDFQNFLKIEMNGIS